MKKAIVYMALLALLLTGCSAKAPSGAQAPDTPAMAGGAQGTEAPAVTPAADEPEPVSLLAYYGEGEDHILEFEGVTLSGEEVDSAGLFAAAKVTMLNIWGTFCGPCIGEMPDIGELSAEYADKGVQVVGVVTDVSDPDGGGAEQARSLLEKAGAAYTNLTGGESVISGIKAQYSFQYIPTTMFVGPDGRLICEPVVGGKDKAAWAAMLDELLDRQY